MDTIQHYAVNLRALKSRRGGKLRGLIQRTAQKRKCKKKTKNKNRVAQKKRSRK